jgi:two-component system sensor histidine kinase ChvG
MPAEIVLDLPGGAPLIVAGLERQLGRVLENLIGNAQSFSPPGSQIILAARQTAGWIEITVDDQGPGIPEDSLERVFERFYTERPPGELFGRHSGLGLSISRQIVVFHRGIIAAANRRDSGGNVCGARFTIRLPAAT